MSGGTVLSVLKYGSFAITALSSMWGLLKETSTKEADGKKRLTQAGAIAIAITISSGLVGTISYALETAIKEQATRDDRLRQDQIQREARLAEQAREERADQRQRELQAQQAADLKSIKLSTELLAQRQALEQVRTLQHLLLASQPLRTLDFSIEFRGLNAKQRNMVKMGLLEAKHLTSADTGEAGYLALGPLENYKNEILRSRILYPLLQNLAEEDTFQPSTETRDVYLLLDLDGSGSIVLPLGGTTGERYKGYVEQIEGLAARIKGSAAHYVPGSDGPEIRKLSGSCAMYEMSISKDYATLRLGGQLSASCLQEALHIGNQSSPTATLPKYIRAVIVSGGKDGLPFIPDNAAVMTQSLSLCWEDAIDSPKGQHVSVDIFLLPNKQTALARRYGRLIAGLSSTLNRQFTPQEDPWEYGHCLPFGIRHQKNK